MERRAVRRDASVAFLVGDWRVDPALNQISRNGAVVHLRPQLGDLLVFFAQHPNEVLSKQQIFDALWPEQYVSESALKGAVAELRHALGDKGHDSRIIENIAKRGYRLIAPVSDVSSRDQRVSSWRTPWRKLAIAFAAAISRVPYGGLGRQARSEDHR